MVRQTVTYYNGAAYVKNYYHSFPLLDITIWQGFGLIMANPRAYRRYYGMRFLPPKSPLRMSERLRLPA